MTMNLTPFAQGLTTLSAAALSLTTAVRPVLAERNIVNEITPMATKIGICVQKTGEDSFKKTLYEAIGEPLVVKGRTNEESAIREMQALNDCNALLIKNKAKKGGLWTVLDTEASVIPQGGFTEKALNELGKLTSIFLGVGTPVEIIPFVEQSPTPLQVIPFKEQPKKPAFIRTV